MILVDYPRKHHVPHLKRDVWAHMVSDTSLQELHEFAKRLDHPGVWRHRDHYDLTPEAHALAISWGAVLVDTREIVRRRVRDARFLKKKKSSTA